MSKATDRKWRRERERDQRERKAHEELLRQARLRGFQVAKPGDLAQIIGRAV